MTTALITGIRNHMSRLVAGVLANQGVTVFGADQELPDPIDGVRLKTTTMDRPALATLLRETRADTVIHLAQSGEEQFDPRHHQPPRANVREALELLGACADTGVNRVVLRSSTLIYGASPNRPARIPESVPLSDTASYPLIRDYVAIERLLTQFGTRNPHVQVVALRCAHLIGDGIVSPLSAYLQQSRPRTLLGFDPLIQVLHPHDAAVAFVLAALLPNASGAYNLAADTPLRLSQAIALTGGIPMPLLELAFTSVHRLSNAAWRVTGTMPFDVSYLRYDCIADTRRATHELGWAAQYASLDTVRSLAEQPETAAMPNEPEEVVHP